MKSDMIRRIELETNIAGRREAITILSVVLMLLGAIVLGHNTIYGSDPRMVGVVVNAPALVIPITNLIMGGLLLAGGIAAYRRR